MRPQKLTKIQSNQFKNQSDIIFRTYLELISVMKFVFLTFTMEGVTGGPSYINNKVKWLKEHGWEVSVFDHYGSLNMKSEIILENLKPYCTNRFLELFFPPKYFSKKQRERILNMLVETIGKSDDYVIETSSPRMALWGELLAQKLHAKHLILEIGEHLEIRSKKEFDFMSFKLNRNELFAINSKVLINMFSKYTKLNDEEANNHLFSATMGKITEEIPFPEIQELPDADYKILSFGRYKSYFENMIEGVAQFSRCHTDKKINFLIMGDVHLPTHLLNVLQSCSNIFYKYIPAMRPVPRVIFHYSDVCIATAGCANTSYFRGVKTISMNVETCQPLGVMGYTTIDSVFSSNQSLCSKSVSELLHEILIEKLYVGEPPLTKKRLNRGYQYQLTFINDDRKFWDEVDTISMDKWPIAFVESLVLRMNGVKLFGR